MCFRASLFRGSRIGGMPWDRAHSFANDSVEYGRSDADYRTNLDGDAAMLYSPTARNRRTAIELVCLCNERRCTPGCESLGGSCPVRYPCGRSAVRMGIDERWHQPWRSGRKWHADPFGSECGCRLGLRERNASSEFARAEAVSETKESDGAMGCYRSLCSVRPGDRSHLYVVRRVATSNRSRKTSKRA